MQHLQKGTKYQVKVRAIPQDILQGTWSEWSESFSFFSPAGKRNSAFSLFSPSTDDNNGWRLKDR